MTPTPEPGQHVWIEAEVVPSVAGHPMLAPITADGQPSAIRLAAARYRWHPADVPPQPPVLAALVDAALLWRDGAISAADPRYVTAGSAILLAACDAYRAALGAPLADVPGPDDSTPEPASAIEARRAALAEREAGEAQEGAQAAPRVANSSTGANGSLPAVQGAGRDWRGEIMQVLADRTGDTLEFWADEADAIVAALGLHELEQAADENLRELNELHLAIDAANGNDGSETNVEAIERLGRECARAIDAEIDRTDELGAVRRELEQLRGENARLRRRMTQLAEDPRMTVYLLQQRLRSALDAGAPATQDGDPK